MKLAMMLALSSLAFAADAAPQMATVCVYRAHALMKARASHPSVYLDGKEVARIHQGTFVMFEVQPGKHLITLGRSEVGQLREMEPGKNQYFRFGHRNLLLIGVTGAQPFTLTEVSEETAREEMKDLKKTKAKDVEE